jgi:hypothetical protein
MKKKILLLVIVMFFNCEKEVLVEQEIRVSLINIIEEDKGGNCSNGGFKIENGTDTNNNNTLDINEVQSTNFICNGSDGNDGINGNNSLLNVVQEPLGDNCLNGGFKIESGIDFNNNEILDADEIQLTNYICNGINGENGNNSLLNIVEESTGDNCTNGGFRIENGIDINNNEVLDANEIQSVHYICNVKVSTLDSSINALYNVEMHASGGQSLNTGGDASNNLNDFKNIPSFLGGSNVAVSPFSSQEEKNAYFGSKFVLIEDNDANEIYPPSVASVVSVLSLIENENNIDVEKFGFQMMPFTWGQSGSPISSMIKGTKNYETFMECVLKAKEFASKEGKTFGVSSCDWYQGEASGDRLGAFQDYYDNMSQLFIDVNNDIKLITGQSKDVQFFTYQTPSNIGFDVGNGIGTHMNVSEAQIQVVRDYENVHFAGPLYQYNFSDAFHPSDRAIVGLQTGITKKRVLYDNKQWNNFIPISHQVINDGTKWYVHLKFGVPVKPLKFDVSGDLWHNQNGKQPNFGFEILDNGIEQQVDEPYIVLGDTVVLTTAKNPEGMIIRYAVNGHFGGGNLCDSQNIIIRNKNVNYVVDNFAAGFSKYIID